MIQEFQYDTGNPDGIGCEILLNNCFAACRGGRIMYFSQIMREPLIKKRFRDRELLLNLSHDLEKIVAGMVVAGITAKLHEPGTG